MEDIEILDLDEQDKIDNKVINKEVKKKKEKKKLRKCEKVFLFVNLLVILGIIGFYAYRTVYYYKLTHDVKTDVTIKDKLTALTNIAYQNDGLYEKDGYFYYKGSDVDNYVFYSGRVFRIIDISSGIRMIEDETTTNLIWGLGSNYDESMINKWLKDYLNTLKDYEVYLEENKWCNSPIDVENYQCEELIDNYVGLLSTSDYLQAGGKNSYLNNETYFWTINQDKDGKALYINSEGSINNMSKTTDTYYSYGIRPVITLKGDISIVSGSGMKDDPYIIEDLGKAMLRDNSVGSFVKYSDQTFRIMAIDDSGVTLMLNNVLEVEKNYTDVFKYLNNDYLKNINKDDLVKMEYTTNEYNFNNQYNYQSSGAKGSNYVTIPKIGDLFLNNYNNYWLNTIANSSLNLYYTIDDNKMFFGDLKGNKHFIRPIIKLSGEMVVELGIGTINDPLIVGDTHVE